MAMRPVRLLFSLPLLLSISACADPAGETASGPEIDATSSELQGASCRALTGLDGTGYAPGAPNVARELASSVGPAFVTKGSAFIPGVLRATQSTSPYAYAATLDLAAWSSISTTSFDSSSETSLYVWVGGSPTEDVRQNKLAKTLFDAMTNGLETSENGAIVRRSSLKSVTCARHTTSYTCVLGPFSNIRQRSGCPE
jgi:hypothetical protein